MARSKLPLLCLLILISVAFIDCESKSAPIQGTKCSKNQVVNKLTVYEDGAIEAECGPIPCGMTGERCIDDQSSCKAETDIFSGMKWAKNGQSLLLRCCSITSANKIYVGTDLVTLGSFYTGGLVAKKDMYGKEGPEYDFVVNARTEQGGVRVWVYRIMCSANAGNANEEPKQAVQPQRVAPSAIGSEAEDEVKPQQPQFNLPKSDVFEKRRQYLLKQLAENQDSPSESVASASVDNSAASVPNPLQYRPPRLQRHEKSGQATPQAVPTSMDSEIRRS